MLPTVDLIARYNLSPENEIPLPGPALLAKGYQARVPKSALDDVEAYLNVRTAVIHDIYANINAVAPVVRDTIAMRNQLNDYLALLVRDHPVFAADLFSAYHTLFSSHLHLACPGTTANSLYLAETPVTALPALANGIPPAYLVLHEQAHSCSLHALHHGTGRKASLFAGAGLLSPSILSKHAAGILDDIAPIFASEQVSRAFPSAEVGRTCYRLLSERFEDFPSMVPLIQDVANNQDAVYQYFMLRSPSPGMLQALIDQGMPRDTVLNSLVHETECWIPERGQTRLNYEPELSGPLLDFALAIAPPSAIPDDKVHPGLQAILQAAKAKELISNIVDTADVSVSATRRKGRAI